MLFKWVILSIFRGQQLSYALFIFSPSLHRQWYLLHSIVVFIVRIVVFWILPIRVIELLRDRLVFWAALGMHVAKMLVNLHYLLSNHSIFVQNLHETMLKLLMFHECAKTGLYYVPQLRMSFSSSHSILMHSIYFNLCGHYFWYLWAQCFDAVLAAEKLAMEMMSVR